MQTVRLSCAYWCVKKQHMWLKHAILAYMYAWIINQNILNQLRLDSESDKSHWLDLPHFLVSTTDYTGTPPPPKKKRKRKKKQRWNISHRAKISFHIFHFENSANKSWVTYDSALENEFVQQTLTNSNSFIWPGGSSYTMQNLIYSSSNLWLYSVLQLLSLRLVVSGLIKLLYDYDAKIRGLAGSYLGGENSGNIHRYIVRRTTMHLVYTAHIMA